MRTKVGDQKFKAQLAQMIARCLLPQSAVFEVERLLRLIAAGLKPLPGIHGGEAPCSPLPGGIWSWARLGFGSKVLRAGRPALLSKSVSFVRSVLFTGRGAIATRVPGAA